MSFLCLCGGKIDRNMVNLWFFLIWSFRDFSSNKKAWPPGAKIFTLWAGKKMFREKWIENFLKRDLGLKKISLLELHKTQRIKPPSSSRPGSPVGETLVQSYEEDVSRIPKPTVSFKLHIRWAYPLKKIRKRKKTCWNSEYKCVLECYLILTWEYGMCAYFRWCYDRA